MAGAQCFDACESDVVSSDELPGRNGVYPPGSSTKVGGVTDGGSKEFVAAVTTLRR